MSLMLSTLKLDLPRQITTNRLLLERLKPSDAEEVFETYASRLEVAKYMLWPMHRTLDDTRSFLDYAIRAWEEGSDYTYAIRLGPGQPLIGSIGIMNADGRIQFGYSLGPAFWGHGYATEVVVAMMDLLRTKRGVYRICTFVDADNHASARVLEKAGLVQEANLVKWHRFVNQGNEPKDCLLYRLVTG